MKLHDIIKSCSNKKLSSSPNQPLSPYGVLTVICAILLLLYLSWYSVAHPFGIFINLRSEQRLPEVLSKLFILLSFAVVVLGTPAAPTLSSQKQRSALFILCIAMYFGESNFIPTAVQAIVGTIICLFIIRGLFIQKNTNAFILFGLFTAGIILGGLADAIDDMLRNNLWEPFFHSPPSWALVQFKKLEETFEFSATIFLLMTVFQLYGQQISSHFKQHKTGILVLFVGFSLIAIGNSLLHFGYDLTTSYQSLGSVFSLIGVTLIVWIGQKKSLYPLSLHIGKDKTLFNILLYGALVALPALHGQVPEPLSAFVWLPIFGLFLVRLLFTTR